FKPDFCKMGAIRSTVVRGGDVDSKITRFPFFKKGTIDSAAKATARISASLYSTPLYVPTSFSLNGVGTDMMNTSASSIFMLALNFLDCIVWLNASGKPGS